MSNNPTLSIREATEQDVATILEFIRELAAYEKASDRVFASEEILRGTLFGIEPRAKALIVNSGEDIAAFAIYFFSFASFTGFPNLYLEDIFVRPAYRGLGVGKELMTFLARIAVEKKCGRMEWAVLNWNEPAIQFYRHLGAEPVTEWTVFHLGQESLTALANQG